ncbi:NADH dehydrogenase [ubiquinone] 1 beta subcomplex subunit 8, mitochondrial-like [Xenia sp. Carnegie-2017]|uniref:NADH dehydrogenase [ubiquinone] 1 beta subcomplex subunit 8, mitochondrial-like n=1 Tax=Xenia sp. Carnegie-2017 TaxID=2897299 RepID=UPI001F042D2A|nr:NADH dehydrogenase [ubiquinone] 1 beta subcomplex subunit 8, mitochondrial-like [Xenia sp. Carnegie-2017]
MAAAARILSSTARRILPKVYRKIQISPGLNSCLQNRLASSKPGGRSDWPDDGLGLGNYPKLPDISSQTRAPHGWWDVQEKRNFGDTLHEEDDAYNVWMYDAPEKSKYPPNEALRHLLTMFSLLAVFMYVGYLYGKTERGNRCKYTPKQFPYNEDLHIYKDGDPKQRLRLG